MKLFFDVHVKKPLDLLVNTDKKNIATIEACNKFLRSADKSNFSQIIKLRKSVAALY